MEFAGCASVTYPNMSLLARKCLAAKHFFVDIANHKKMPKKTPNPNPSQSHFPFQLHRCPSVIAAQLA